MCYKITENNSYPYDEFKNFVYFIEFFASSNSSSDTIERNFAGK